MSMSLLLRSVFILAATLLVLASTAVLKTRAAAQPTIGTADDGKAVEGVLKISSDPARISDVLK